ncbi:ribonuclease T2-like protein [Multifurca ochricompacta]|uniref:ribonuclease T2 n=1 Tax=Multifurca ochricompacta TaxID=376703 RepID=A0AAD4M3F3_9AGAM|nr:ribonuclease T2-like protein [Multifurca ochricompacta]
MFTLFAILVNVAVTLVSAQGLVSADMSHLFDKRLASGCSTSGPASCSTPIPSDLCCFESPGGLLLQTQDPVTAGQFKEARSLAGQLRWHLFSNCDSSRAYTDIAGLLTSQGANDTLAFMRRFWVDIDGQDERFWEHEWSTHGTCYSTLQTSCLPSGSPQGAEAVAYFQQVVALFKTLPTYNWLASHGITPSTTQTYTLAQLTSALKAASGFAPALGCSGSAINQISWYFHLSGSLLDGEFIPIDSPIKSKCVSSGLRYPPKF